MITLVVILLAVAVLLSVIAAESWPDFWRAIPMIIVLELIGIGVIIGAIVVYLCKLLAYIRMRYKPNTRL